MFALEGAFWIRNEENKYLHVRGETVVAADRGPRGVGLLKSNQSRSQIWLVEKANGEEDFRIRNYHTNTALCVQNEAADGESVGISKGSSENQVWKIEAIGRSASQSYSIKNPSTSTLLTALDGALVPAAISPAAGRPDRVWFFEPAALPAMYWISNVAVSSSSLVLQHNSGSNVDVQDGVTIAEKHAFARNQLWMLDFTPADACIIRSVSDDTLALGLSTSNWSTALCKAYNGQPIQRWKIKNTESNKIDLCNEYTGMLLTAFQVHPAQDVSLNLLGVNSEDDIRAPQQARWDFNPFPIPPCFWVTIQDVESRNFLAQASHSATLLSQTRLATNHLAQWRFIMVPSARFRPNLLYIVVNRATGMILCLRLGSAGTITASVGSREQSNISPAGWYLTIDSAENSHVKIINMRVNRALDSNIMEVTKGCKSQQQWMITPCYDSLPSFSVVSAQTGRSITYGSGQATEKIITTNSINESRSQWIFRPSSSGTSYTLLNKSSGIALDYHVDSLEACKRETSLSLGHSCTQWKLSPHHGRFIALADVDSGHYLCDTDLHIPAIDISHYEMPSEDRTKCWELVSHRRAGFDFISLDEGILRGLVLDGNTTAIHLPQLAKTTDNTVRWIMWYFINRWGHDIIPSSVTVSGVVSSYDNFGIQWEVSLPLALRPRSTKPAWVHIDLQGVAPTTLGQRMATIQGYFLDSNVFRVIAPAGIPIGRENIQLAMLRSLNTGLSEMILPTPARPIVKKVPTTSASPPSPAAGGSNTNVFASMIIPTPVLPPRLKMKPPKMTPPKTPIRICKE